MPVTEMVVAVVCVAPTVQANTVPFWCVLVSVPVPAAVSDRTMVTLPATRPQVFGVPGLPLHEYVPLYARKPPADELDELDVDALDELDVDALEELDGKKLELELELDEMIVDDDDEGSVIAIAGVGATIDATTGRSAAVTASILRRVIGSASVGKARASKPARSSSISASRTSSSLSDSSTAAAAPPSLRLVRKSDAS